MDSEDMKLQGNLVAAEAILRNAYKQMADKYFLVDVKSKRDQWREMRDLLVSETKRRGLENQVKEIWPELL